MSIDELASAAEIVSSIAVLISLLYLAVQVRRSTDAAHTSTYQSVVSDFGALNHAMASVPELSMLFVNGMEDFESLDAADKARISQLNYSAFRYFENMFYQHKKGYLESEVWEGWKLLMLTYHSRPGFQSWWAYRRDVFSKSFVHFLGTEKLDKPASSYYEVTQGTRNSTK